MSASKRASIRGCQTKQRRFGASAQLTHGSTRSFWPNDALKLHRAKRGRNARFLLHGIAPAHVCGGGARLFHSVCGKQVGRICPLAGQSPRLDCVNHRCRRTRTRNLWSGNRSTPTMDGARPPWLDDARRWRRRNTILAECAAAWVANRAIETPISSRFESNRQRIWWLLCDPNRHGLIAFYEVRTHAARLADDFDEGVSLQDLLPHYSQLHLGQPLSNTAMNSIT